MVEIREAKRALIKQGKPELTWDRWPLRVKAEFTTIRKLRPRMIRSQTPSVRYHK